MLHDIGYVSPARVFVDALGPELSAIPPTLWEGLPAMARMTPEQSQVVDFGDRAVAPFRNTWPVAKWLLDEVAAR